MFANQVAIKGSPDAFLALGPQLKQALAHCPGVRHAQAGTVLHEQLNQVGVVREDIYRPSFDLSQNLGAVVLDFIRHWPKLANTLTWHNRCRGAQCQAPAAGLP